MRSNVEAKIGETTYHLEPTLKALKAVNSAHGSLLESMRRVRTQDFDAICQIISIGCGVDQEKIEQAVFDHGIVGVSEHAANYMVMLMNPGDSEGDDSGNV